MAMAKTMVLGMPKFPPIPASLQKTSGHDTVPGFPPNAGGQILRDQTAYPSLEAGGILGIDARGRSYRIRRAIPKYFGVTEAGIRFNLPV
jgi:hypothetical protein